MKLGSLLSATAALALSFGLSFLLVPYMALAAYGITEVSSAHRYAIQWFGAALVAIAMLDWAARHAADSEARRAIVLANLVHSVLGVGLAVAGVLQGTVNAFGWVSVAIYALLVVAFLRARYERDEDVAHAHA